MLDGALATVCGIFIFSTTPNHEQGIAALHVFLRKGKRWSESKQKQMGPEDPISIEISLVLN